MYVTISCPPFFANEDVAAANSSDGRSPILAMRYWESRLKDDQSNVGLDTLHTYLEVAKTHRDQTHDRAVWRQIISKADHATKREKR
ncbi:hypothetical protein ANCDUO_01212 [Ancylostoma duodenale]|uniref:Uncharacterized protein n=1 Tax=Ancylostoma duodenale TaxID=51022 RepID=A0A0C2H3P8_9BILA|nr:hypothetical protein ANCDUO_01212 [Ancylostoma duodenale]